MKNQDEVDTAPVLFKDDTRVTFESIELSPGERAELVLIPDRPLRNPILFMSSTQKESDVAIEQVLHGHTAIFVREKLTLDQLRFGKAAGLTVTENEPIKIIVVNVGPFKTTVGASLVANTTSQDSTYRLSGDQLVKDQEKNKE
jgi:hypothetical protein